MPSKRQVLAALVNEELALLVQQHGISVDGRGRAHLMAGLEEQGPSIPEMLAGFSRKRLKELCRRFGLEDHGHAKAEIAARLAAPPEGARKWEPESIPLVRGIPALSVTHPHLAEQWHPTRNGKLEPSDVSARTPTVVWWICGAAHPHVWQAAVSARAQSDSLCPTCAFRPKTALAERHPELAREFHPTKNWPLSLDDIGIGSDRRIWWRCFRNPEHEWQTSVQTRIRKPGCPLCDGRIVTPRTSLAGKYPEIAAEWHPTKNGDLRPEQVRPSWTKHAFWQCSRNPEHVWEARVWQRTRTGTGCPVCFGSALSPEVTFAATHPEVAAEWHPTKNGDLRPDQMRAGSERRVWWRCARDPTHEWRTFIVNRALAGHGCPMCSGRVATPTTSLAARFPEIAARWHPTKNGALTPDRVMPNAKAKYWWQCPKDPKHVWKAEPSGKGRCPLCLGKKVTSANSLAGTAPAIAAEWHPEKNGRRRPEQTYWKSTARAWWRCTRDARHEWESTVACRVKAKNGCPFCAGRLPGPTSSLAAVAPAVAAEWHPTKNGALTPHDVVPGGYASVWWRCAEGHEWRVRVRERGVLGTGCPVCSMARHKIWLAENNRERARKRREARP
jgi:hypothetical protein